ncbi:SufE family protein [Simiduia sp. 21SJ11W-1]|uniref:SufE family protein n=1 Tax=Simiduia sp. 21SJ11W-1 TaxID=2909669 RepID=UPI0020A0E1C3|nr:SufE family protein [Simiduia sp. 21SJ11W-1]UTA47620.1 SufE family protein [Simiduia sp. 21SJ11W-1]
MSFQAPLDDFSALDPAELSRVQGWAAKYKMLMAWGNRVQVKPWLRCDQQRVRGCETALWLAHAEADGRHWFAVDGESRIVKGLAVLLLVHINGQSRTHIAALDLPGLLAAEGLEKHLSPSRSNGFNALVTRVREWLVHA